jgi:hypothetical protein
MRDITEIYRENDETLLTTAKQRIANCPILNEIYDDAFLLKVIYRKSDYDNLLLMWLVTDNPCAINFFQKIEENLKLLSATNVKKFKEKLRQWNTEHFESTITEIEFAAEFARKGFQIEVEPTLPNGKKGDFCITKGSLKIFFEVKTIFSQKSHEEHLISEELCDRYKKLNTRFVICLEILGNFRRSQIFEVIKYIEKRLKILQKGANNFPQSFVYPETGNPIIEIEAVELLPEGEKGFVRYSGLEVRIKGNWNDLRSKISSGVSQLHPDYPGVIIVQPHGFSTMEFDIQNALLGDLKVSILLGRSLPFRGEDRIFGKNKNKRLSAVVFCQKRLQMAGYVSKITIVHNPFAKTKLPREIFEGANVTQYPS